MLKTSALGRLNLYGDNFERFFFYGFEYQNMSARNITIELIYPGSQNSHKKLISPTVNCKEQNAKKNGNFITY